LLNHTPAWKKFLIVLVLSVTFLYAVPNLYGEDPAVQVSGVRGAQLTAAHLDRVQELLKSKNITVKSIELEKGKLLVRLTKDDDQNPARETLKSALGDSYIVALNLSPATPFWLDGIGAVPMKLGLDLRGGVHFLMEVNMDEVIEKNLKQTEQDFRSALREEKIRYSSRPKKVGDKVTVKFDKEETADKASSLLSKKYRDYLFNIYDIDGAFELQATMTEAKLKDIKQNALEQNITIIRSRVNQLGVAEPLVQRQGEDRLVVELPGVQDTARAKEILAATATLEFRLLTPNADPMAAENGSVPAGSELHHRRDGSPVVLKKKVILEGSYIVNASGVGVDDNGQPQVSIDLNSEGGSKMSAATRHNVGQPMATLFIEYKSTDKRDAKGKLIFRKHQEVINVATIQAVLGSSFRITGLDSKAEAKNLALLLRAGALIAPIQIVEERTIGPSLGAENIKKGLDAILYGIIALLIFMPIYYRKFGVVASVALVTNIGMIVGIMSMIPGATLTLPGMAGIVLTMGMAVDANVLIFERIREEMKDGCSPQQAIQYGYSNALSSISDANITTFLTALILFSIGTGPIKGFAITLMIGIVTSMFTAIVASRAIVNSAWGGKQIEKLSI